MPPKVFNEKPLLGGNATTTSSFMFETREIVTTHCVALDATHVTLSVPWADEVATNVDEQTMVLRSAATANREGIRCHFMDAWYVATVESNRGVTTKDRGRARPNFSIETPGRSFPRYVETWEEFTG